MGQQLVGRYLAPVPSSRARVGESASPRVQVREAREPLRALGEGEKGKLCAPVN